MSTTNNSLNKGDRNKIYFLIAVIAALIGTNGYLFLKDKKQSERYASISSEKDRLKLEVEKIEVELDKANALNLTLTDKLQGEQQSAREKIAELKVALQKNQVSKNELDKAQKEVRGLREFVRKYNVDIDRLQKENTYLKTSKDSLQKTVNTVNQKVGSLQRENAQLSSKVKSGAALKAENISIKAYRVKSSGRNVEVTRYGTAQKLNIKFNIVPNSLAEKKDHTIYLRVFDPAGNLIITNENDLFEANNQEMQYSHHILISYNDDSSTYTIDWMNPKEFIKGLYTVILYADGFTMGRSQIELR